MTHRVVYRKVQNAISRLDRESSYLDDVNQEYFTDKKEIELAQFYIKRAQKILAYIKQSDFRRKDYIV